MSLKARAALATLCVIAVTALVLYAMGRVPICSCGTIKFWEGDVNGPGNSQQISDWYTFSHIIHGFLFFAATWWLAKRWPMDFSVRLLIATLVEAGWEILENSPIIIDRYREATIAQGYNGDSVLNSVCDIVSMVLGFWLAARLPVWVTVVLALAMELIVGALIRDNLTLNVLMLLWPIEAVKSWQSGA
ncbi:hypothetical protein HDIA_4055 [Hartmannibacter diazotrophicus]|uniref:UPF0314 protein HDIA_4055 n=1 Tax=Hartmannibacter diazotrophicus TaxID=1482074 RepID=A0A2C9DBG0_9HYPH|nr:DUF2585 domain-containing protein [Hartmannibacter diazotrophicus]SON57596.1 hypothetical protein HDIA_4055 [Hartmannibacter diazotrophicus]